MKTVMTFIRVPLAVGTLMLVMSASIAPGQESPANAYCPVSPDEEAELQYHAEYEGRTVYFCCSKCRRKFLADPEQYVSTLPVAEHNAVAESSSHDHDDDHAVSGDDAKAAGKLGRYLGNMHPMVVHFPIAFIILAFVMEWLSVFRKSDRLTWAAQWVTGCAALSAVPAALFGWEAAEHANYSSEMLSYVTTHRWLGVSVTALSLAAWITARMQYRKLFRFLITILALLVMLTGYFGAALVYGIDHLSW